MFLTLEIGATGMQAQELNVNVISNNIANMTTTAFKKQRAQFQDLLYQTQLRGGAASSNQNTTIPEGIQLGLGVKTGSVYRINEQGTLQITGNPLDIANEAAGYFQITLPDGTTAYTRDGSFQQDQNGHVVTSQGYLLQPGITIPTNTVSITISPVGQVQIQLQNQTALQTVGQLQLAIFPNQAGLDALGNNLFKQTEASGNPVTGNPGDPGFGTLEQGALENSNVDVVTEITNLIQAQRAYEMNSKVIQSGSDMLTTISQVH
jgi:flagellar basal-body rod protein FlgG